jgi:dihydrofolate reductase
LSTIHHRPGEPALRKIISFTHATLDGYIDDPHEWSFQYSDEELQEYGLKMTLAADALLLGRITYEGMAQAWPTRGGNPFADHVNSITKYVVASQPVDTTAWDPTVVIAGPDLLDEVSRLKQASETLAGRFGWTQNVGSTDAEPPTADLETMEPVGEVQ